MFVLGNTAGQLTCVKLGRMRGLTSVHTLAQPSSVLGRVWTSLTSSLAAPADRSDQALSAGLAVVGGVGLALLAVCRDHKLRAWSLATYECVMAADLVAMTAEAGRELRQGAQGHRLAVVGGDGREAVVALYLCFHQHSQFLLVRVASQAGQLTAAPASTVYCPDFDLVDFAVSPERQVTAVWTTGEGETVIRRTVAGAQGWEAVATTDGDAAMLEDLEMSASEDPRQTYLGALFAPGAFLASTLAKTVAIFRRSLDREGVDGLGWERLKAEVVAAVEAEVQGGLVEYEVSDEEYVSASRAAWARFYSCACQYRSAGRQPMGLVPSPASSAVLLIRRELVSWLRPVEALEQVVVSGGQGLTAEVFRDIPGISDNPSLAQDVLQVLQAAGMVGRLLPASIVATFSEAVGRLQSPDLVSRSIAADLLADQEQPAALQDVVAKVQQVGDVPAALECLLYCLELDRGSVSSGELDISLVERDTAPRVFSSDLGVSLVAASLRQQVDTRLELAQQLLITQHLVLSLSNSLLPPDTLDVIQSTFLPRTTVMVHCYSVLHWLCAAPATPPTHALLAQSSRQLAVLRLDEGGVGAAPPPSREHASILELFLVGPGARVRAVVGDVAGDAWLAALPPLTNMTAQLLWPRCAAPTFLHFLLVSCQHLLIQQYCRLLSTWCDWHCHARQFLLATALLNMCEQEKAADLFLSAAGGVPGDKFLTEHLLNLQGASSDDLTLAYFLRIISLLEQFSCPDLVIAMAETGLAVAPQGHPERPTLAYILFSYHLKLGHNDDAYDAMVSNPDTRRRKDSLRQFLVTLFDRGELAALARYPYIDMMDDVETIIESRARSADLSVNNYYDFLYSFHVMKENYRKAAHVMFECGARLGLELVSVSGLRKQVQAYLATINSLKLVSAKYQWIVRPGALNGSTTPKRLADGEEKVAEMATMEVVELKDIEKELVLTQARLKLVKFSSSSELSLPVTPGLSPAETVALLAAANLYWDAVTLCQTFGLPRSLVLVVEALASRCVKLSGSRGGEQAAAWSWLVESRVGGSEVLGDSPVEAAWHLLQLLVTEQEERGATALHRAALRRLASLSCAPPPWLLAGYKKRDAAELVRTLHGLGHIEAAGEVAVELVRAVLGVGSEYFGLEGGLVAGGRAAWLPWTVLDRLLLELQEHQELQGVARVKCALEGAVEQYLETVDRVSRDMVAARA